MATNLAVQQEALTRAVSSQSLSNYAAIIRGFMAKGLAESEISPRENVFTYNAWKALGRQVRKGEHGVKCITVITTKNKTTGRDERRPWTTTVFHVSQTEKIRAIACNDALDATAENIPYAGEAELDTPELQAHSDAVHAGRVPFDEFIAAEREKQPEPVPAGWDSVGPGMQEPEVIPAPAPKESAYNRAMRGETVSIMDIIDDLSGPKRKSGKPLPRRLQSASFSDRVTSASKSYQSKTVDF